MLLICIYLYLMGINFFYLMYEGNGYREDTNMLI